ncbi:MAG TPA: CDP-alcohol phosphatidyltransferase family protein [Gaiellales bacterium]|nr:CDP-alcohol phosphatidyltransferase family protein [Gaiellales bacterium]
MTFPLYAAAGLLILLTGIWATVGLSAAGWIAGAVCGVAVIVAVAAALRRHRGERLGPAGWCTLARGLAAAGVAALTVESLGGRSLDLPVALLASAALALDFADGRIARRTGTVTRLGARLDGEMDAFLILILSIYVARSHGGWVLAIGAARYLFLAAGAALPWMRAELPPRDWRKVVAATQGVVLTAAAAGVLPAGVADAALGIALALLAESFGRDVWWLWRHRSRSAAPRRLPRGASTAITVVAFVVVWAALVAPDRPNRLNPEAFVRLPIEGVAVITLALVLPLRWRPVLAWLVGPLLGLVVLVKVLDVGFFTAFDRPFDPFDDWRYLSIGIETLHASIGTTEGNLVLAGVAVLFLVALVLPTLAVLRMTRVAAGNRRVSLRVAAAMGVAWAACWTSGARLVPGSPIASVSAAELAMHEVQAVQAGFADEGRFAAEIRRDRFGATPGNRLLTALRGKDVLLVFVESYGQVAVQGTSYSPGVDRVLAAGNRELAAAGFHARSGWLTSSTFGGISWLAHSTLQSGLWVDTQSRYDQLMGTSRLTLTRAFGRAGWRTVADVPSNDRAWPDGTGFYRYDKVYDRRNVGYQGPTYAYASMPDQYVLLGLQQLELGRRHRPPLFAEVDLVSSHEPWTQIPPLIPWSAVGDGSVFYRRPVDTTSVRDTADAYGTSIQYTLRALFSFVQRYGRSNLVMIVLGDHQPGHIVTRFGVNHQVPISVIAHDPAVLRRIQGWRWANGMRPSPASPVWRMSAFRDRFLRAFGSTPSGAGG